MLFLSFFSFAQSIEIKNYYDPQRKIIKEAFFVKSKYNKELHGPYKSYYLNGNIKSKGNYNNNLPDGYWEYFYENNNLKSAGVLKDNQMNGKWKYYFENGNINMEGEMKDGVRMGEWKFYYESGGLKMSGNLEGEEKKGHWKYYYEDGKLKADALFINNKGHYQEYYSNGKLKMEGLIKDGKSDSLWRYYHENGKLQAKGFEKDGLKSGKWKFFHENGSLASEGEFVNGETTGVWKYYHPNGNISAEGVEESGVKEGYWKLYYENAAIKGEGNYVHGDGEYKEYYESGKLKAQGNIKNGKNEGEWVYYYENGKVEAKCIFREGEGLYVGYYENGAIKMEGVIKDNKKVGVWKLYDQKGKLAGYYTTFYDNNIVQFQRMPEAQALKDSVMSYEKPDIKLRKRKSRYFSPKHNEFKSFIVATNPAAMIIGSVPLSVEYYVQERLGFEFIYTWIRKPFFINGNNVGFNKIYDRGYATAIRMKFYQPDDNLGMFYFANELRFTHVNHLANVLDTSFQTPISTSIKARESKFEYSFLVGNRFMKYSYETGFTMDFFIGLGAGYRIYKEKFPENTDYQNIFEEVNSKPLSLSPRVGFTLGYAF